MDETPKSIQEIFLKSSIGQQILAWIEPFRPDLEKHRDAFLICALILLVAFPFLCVKAMDKKFVNEDIGFEVAGPQWSMIVSRDKQSATYQKYKTNRPGNAVIKVNVALDNLPGASAQDYVYKVLMPKLVANRVELRDQPYALDRKGREWAKASFYINGNDLQIFTVTVVRDYVLILNLSSTGKDHSKNERIFNKTWDSVVIKNPKE